jgi:hypothetical protein
VAQFCAEEQHAFWEAHGHMDKLIEEEIIDEEQGKFLKMWLQANCQGDIDDQALQGLSAINGSRDFTKWCFDHLNTFLRMEHDNHWSQRAIGASDTEIATVLRDMSANLRGMTQDRGNGVADTVGSAKEVAIKPYSVYETAALMGFCGITDKTQIPVIWGLFKTSKEVKDHRLNIAKRMAVWLGANGIPIDHSIFFLKETIEDIVKLRSNPGGRTRSQHFSLPLAGARRHRKHPHQRGSSGGIKIKSNTKGGQKIGQC